LSEDSQKRLEANPMRILDSKDPRDRPIADAAPEIDTFLTDEALDFFGSVTEGLQAAGVAWTRNARLVRGLDYYRHTAFEFVTDRLGAQGTVLGGGRYDGLIESLGGKPTPAVGWAAGIERLAMLLGDVPHSEVQVAIYAQSAEFQPILNSVAHALRRSGISCRHNFTFRNPQKVFDRFNKDGVPFILSVSEAEMTGCDARVALGLSGDGTWELAEKIEAALGHSFDVFRDSSEPIPTRGWDIRALVTKK
jgi:histidyl-tRNA synthetase